MNMQIEVKIEKIIKEYKNNKFEIENLNDQLKIIGKDTQPHLCIGNFETVIPSNEIVEILNLLQRILDKREARQKVLYAKLEAIEALMGA